MKPEDLLDAMNDIDCQLIEHAPKKAPKKHRRKPVYLLFAAVLVTALSVTAFASEELGNWFQQLFEANAEKPLSQGQKQFLNDAVIENTQGKTEVSGKATLTLDSAVSDGYQFFIKFHLTAPEDVVLLPFQKAWYEPGNGDRFTNSGTVIKVAGARAYNSVWFYQVEDGDGKSNTMDFYAQGFLNGPWLYDSEETFREKLLGKTLQIQIKDIYAFLKEEKEPAEPSLLIKGDWSFEVPFTEEGLKTVELLSAPIKAPLQYFDLSGDEKTVLQDEVQITSIKLRALSMTVFYEYPDSARNQPGFFGTIQVVMKDGSTVKMEPFGISQSNVNQYCSQVPVAITEADHLLFEDGTIIPIHE